MTFTQWPAQWEPVPPQQGARLTARLACEAKEGHALFGVAVTCLAQRGDCDDVLFALDGGPAVAVVHLTYSRVPLNPEWPSAATYADLQAWANAEVSPLSVEKAEPQRDAQDHRVDDAHPP